MDGKKVELHIHLDSAWRFSTLWELAQKKNVKPAGVESLDDMKKFCVCNEAKSLSHFLKPHRFLTPIYSGDLDAVERLAYEFCEDVAGRGVVYTEVRLVPQRLLGPELAATLGYDGLLEVVKRVSHGLSKAESDLGIRSRIILTAMYNHPEWKMTDTFRVCQNTWDLGVVGLDLCTWQPDGSKIDEAPLVEPVETMMEEARKCGVYRTIHAGEVSGPAAIERAAYKLRSDRVGHGYHVVQDPQLYSRCLQDRVHFECCPYSSYLTAAIPRSTTPHPILRFAEDGANFSISSDDPTLTGHFLDGDYALAKSFGLSDAHLARANVNAAKASFLSESEKKQLVKEICKSYNLEEDLDSQSQHTPAQ